MRAIGRDPLFIERGDGAELVDVDGNRYVDYVCSWGPLIHGHAHPQVLAAVARRRPTRDELRRADRRRGRARGGGRAPDARRRDAADDLLGHRGHDDRLRLARAATGASGCVKFAGAYHGHVDGLLAQAGSGLATQALPASPGVPARARPRHRRRALERPARRCSRSTRAATRLAAIIAEPLPANMGLVPPAAGLPGAAARARRRERRAADPRRGDQRLSRRPRRRAGADRACAATSTSWARSSAAACPRRRSAAAPS